MRATAALVALLMAGCATQPPLARDKEGATQAEFERARYRCLQESSGQSAAAVVGPYGAAGSSGIACNYQLYDACMSADGFRLVQGGRFNAPVYCRS